MDWKLLGYFVSSISVMALGAAAWPGAEKASWHMAALIAGMAFSVLGMSCRYYSHRQEKAAIAYARRKAEEQ